MSSFVPEAVAQFLQGRSQEVQTLFGVQVVLVLLLVTLLASETLRTRNIELPGKGRVLRASVLSLLILFSSVVAARLVSIT